jgi:hypothetical protein
MIDKKQYGTPKVRLRQLRIGRVSEVDLWFCRDCPFHLSNRDIILALRNFLTSGTRLVFTTTHLNSAVFESVDIRTGGFRRIDLFSTPYFFQREVLARIPGLGRTVASARDVSLDKRTSGQSPFNAWRLSFHRLVAAGSAIFVGAQWSGLLARP